ncbi:DNA replication complex GINS protein Psf2p [[Candida] railenensis]|uniref:DNA replication complex GINS protein PSF2 n=1 Tax=[Candida] railenensis TaxID=45579 RepID=A0A9P0VVG3_9ASCO|nr:DNA replication complex GINS protein Psf2p [[Candida] railenensis]
MRRANIPLWIALILKSQDKCNIVPPDWLTVAYLKSRYDEELAQPHRFSSLPWHWLETSKILLARASDDLSDSTSQLKSIIQDLREVRLVKSRKGLRELNESNIQLDGLSLLEINELRPFVLSVMNKLRQLHESVTTTAAESRREEGADEASDDDDDY